MQSATAWRRRKDTTPLRGSSPTRPHPDSIERLSPDPYPPNPATPPPTHTNSSLNRHKRQHVANSVQGLGLSQNLFSERSIPHPDHMYLDSNGSAHLGAKSRSPKHSFHPDHESASLQSPSKTSSLQYRSAKVKGHTRSGSTIDDLANIAIATSPQFNSSLPTLSFGGSPQFHTNSRPSTSYVNGYSQESFDRPAKRIKSDRYFTNDASIKEERPRTSSAHHSEIRPEDVELLLNVRNAFRAPLPSSAPLAQAEFTPHVARTESAEIQSLSRQHEPINEPYDAEPIPVDIQDRSTIVAAPISEDSPAGGPHIRSLRDEASSEQPSFESTERSVMTKQEPDLELSIDQEEDRPPPIQAATGTVESHIEHSPAPASIKKQRRIQPTRVAEWCSVCRNTQYAEAQGGDKIDWIECAGCKRWLHYPCAGFQKAQDTKKVDKFFCQECVPIHGETTYVRTSSRARTAPDYAALNEGLTKSSDENIMHHYIHKFKNRELSWRRDDFARVRPALLTEEWWENMDGMKRPFVVPACWNPKFGVQSVEDSEVKDVGELASQAGKIEQEKKKITSYVKYNADRKVIEQANEPWDLTTEADADKLHEKTVIDLNQDYLGMVMPYDLTVRKVSELYGANEPVPVIDVKSQATKGKFTLRQWANYYEQPEGQPVKNVISLEISQSRLGRLIRRPKVVQDIDLEDQVWDLDSRSAINKKSVAYYCLMSVADSYTDFHIDFGGSSVYYHILKGMKTFFFIPPEEKYLKKYEEWCNSAEQGQTWLGDLCNGNVTRVDLHPGDTAFIPAGWIHSVWTPEHSLVIGGNFLTRYDLDLQIKVAQIEKDTDVALPYRYPHFQKVMWYTLIKYLDDDPVPDSVIRDFLDDPDYRYLRANPIWAGPDIPPADYEPEDGESNVRNYSKSELRGLPVLRDYLYRTARIYADLPVEKIDKKKIEAVKRSIPKGHGDPMQLICLFAVFCAWKIGNVTAPEWIHSDNTVPLGVSKTIEETKKAERIRIPPERASTRRRNINSPAPEVVAQLPENEESSGSPAPSRAGFARIACESCRKKKQTCRHIPGMKDETPQQTLEKTRNYPNVTIDIAKLASASPVVASVERAAALTPQRSGSTAGPGPYPVVHQVTPEVSTTTDLAQAALARMSSQPPETNGVTTNATTPGSAKKGRSKACDECRKSKRRCVHDVNGRVDPVKAAEPSKPRGSSSSKRPARISDEHQSKRSRPDSEGEHQYPVFMTDHDLDAMIDPALMAPVDPMLGLSYHDLNVPMTDVAALSTPPLPLTTENSFSIMNGSSLPTDNVLDPALTNPQALDSNEHDYNGIAETSDEIQTMNEAPQQRLSNLPQLGLITVNTPDVDKSFSPITADTSSAEIALRSGAEEDTNLHSQHIMAQDDAAMQEVPVDVAGKPESAGESSMQDNQRRHSSNATGVSPKHEIMSLSSTRSSSHTSGNTHEEANSEQPVQLSAGTGEQRWMEEAAEKQEHIPVIKQEIADTVEETIQMRRASTAASSVSDVAADEEFARRLQMEEMGLRRRTSVRAP